MSRVNFGDALQCAVNTLESQPREVPEAPKDWLARAKAALASKNKDEIVLLANEIAKSHSQYNAEFDVKGWLYDLRECLWERAVNGVPPPGVGLK
jgi:hypothetical protein